MTMFTLPNFCRICLKYDKTLIDLEHIENEPNEPLMSKLQQVSEVEWNVFKPLLCHPCIKRLNIAYGFKKQAAQSASLLKNYITLVESKNIGESLQNVNELAQSNTYMMFPNQKYIKILVGPQAQTSMPNMLVNIVPTVPVLNAIPPVDPLADNNNQNVFFNINDTFQKYVPPIDQPTDLNVTQILTECTSEELSVEIDPTDFGMSDGGASDDDSDDTPKGNNWEDVISAMKVAARTNGSTFNGSTKSELAKSSSFGNYVPILPKQPCDEKMDFSYSGEHFLSSQLFQSYEYLCERCQKQFASKLTLRYHIKSFHMGKMPFKCDFCGNEFMIRGEYESCLKGCAKHYKSEDALSASITLSDLKHSQGAADGSSEEAKQDQTELTCAICFRNFNSASGLLRHKVRKHEEKTKKKYFIKGMKNAKCDICNREFSTQSYMQLHRKLHLRDDIGYKYKVLGKSRYIKSADEKPAVSDSEPEKADNQISKSNKSYKAKIKSINGENKQAEDESNSDNPSEH